MNLTKSDFEKITRKDGRKYNQMRTVKITTDVVEYAEGSALVEFGKTRVLCAASVENKSAPWLIGSGSGWVTAEYGMLPRSTHTRIKREKSMTGGRTQEISRLIGRSLRAAVDLKSIYEKQIIIDCDVINADGGTRTAAITGGFVAWAMALNKMKNNKAISTLPLKSYVSPVTALAPPVMCWIALATGEDLRSPMMRPSPTPILPTGPIARIRYPGSRSWVACSPPIRAVW